jgi:hypothetical protein
MPAENRTLQDGGRGIGLLQDMPNQSGIKVRSCAYARLRGGRLEFRRWTGYLDGTKLAN